MLYSSNSSLVRFYLALYQLQGMVEVGLEIRKTLIRRLRSLSTECSSCCTKGVVVVHQSDSYKMKLKHIFLDKYGMMVKELL